MTILLTGAGGFIGSHVRHALLDAGHVVIAPTRSRTGKTDTATLQWLEGFFGDPSVLKKARRVPEAIIHLAAIRGAGAGERDHYQKVNVIGTQALLDYARQNRVKRFIYCSTVGVLGTIPARLPAAPDDPPRADGPYHHTKWMAEKHVREAADKDMTTMIVRPTITYGRGDDGFIPRLIDLVRKGWMVTPAREVKIHLLSVRAFASLLEQCVRGDAGWGGTFHVADKSPVALRDVVDFISKQTRGDTYPRWLKAPSFLYDAMAGFLKFARRDALKTSVELISKSWYYNIDATISQLGYQPVETLDQMGDLLS